MSDYFRRKKSSCAIRSFVRKHFIAHRRGTNMFRFALEVIAFVHGLVEAGGLEDYEGLVQDGQGLVKAGQLLKGHAVVRQTDGTSDSSSGSSIELLMKKGKRIAKKKI
nr:hypothetical protein [Tanacetum cinerariifolium]